MNIEVGFGRIGNLITAIQTCNGERFYSLEDVLKQLHYPISPLDERQHPVDFEGRIIFGYRLDGSQLVWSAFIDEAGLKKLLPLG